MSDETKYSPPPPDTEPTAERSHLLIWIIVLMLLLMFMGGVAFDDHSGWFDKQVYAPFDNAAELESYQPRSGAAAALAQGKKVYEQVCGICHGVDGLGKPGTAPPLAGSEWVNAQGHNRLAHIPLMGINGTIRVVGNDWNMSMAAMGASLSDADLAAVLTYIRSSWGNKAGAVTADDIKSIRAGMGAHIPPMNHDQLMSMPE
jgi:mono/diheme cytochrome c family protein